MGFPAAAILLWRQANDAVNRAEEAPPSNRDCFWVTKGRVKRNKTKSSRSEVELLTLREPLINRNLACQSLALITRRFDEACRSPCLISACPHAPVIYESRFAFRSPARVEPTIRPTKCDVLCDQRVLRQFPRSCKLLKYLFLPDSHGGSHRFESCSAHQCFLGFRENPENGPTNNSTNILIALTPMPGPSPEGMRLARPVFHRHRLGCRGRAWSGCGCGEAGSGPS